MLAALLQVSAKAYAQGITLSEKNASLGNILKKIEKQSGYSFCYTHNLVNQAFPVNIKVSNASLFEAMNLAFRGQQLTFTIIEKTIVVKRKPGPAPRTEIRGRVVDQEGAPVFGATVNISGTTQSINTNANGDFTLIVYAPDPTLVFTHVSMQPEEIRANAKNQLLVIMKDKPDEMGEVVNTGYNTAIKERLNGSIAKLDSIHFHVRIGRPILERLPDNMPGLLLNKKGDPFSSPILIRGISTLGLNNTSTAPLIVVDNFPMPDVFVLNNINPNDVDNVAVLKDAAAASIWGSRAGNGVIVITTKKGKYRQPFHIDLSTNLTIESKPDLYYYPRISASDFIDIERFLFDKNFYKGSIENISNRPVISPVVEILARKQNGMLSADEANAQINILRNNDVRKELDKYLYRNAIKQQYYLGLGGGTDKIAYQASFGFNKNLNNIQGSQGIDQFTMSGNTSFKPIKKLEILAGVRITSTSNRSTNFNLPTPLSPYARLMGDDGEPLAIPFGYRQGYIDTAGQGILEDWHYKPLDEIRYADNKTDSRFMRFNVGLGYEITKAFKAEVIYQYQETNADMQNYQSMQSWDTRNLVNRFTNPNTTDPALRNPVPKGGILDENSSMARLHNLRGQLNFKKYFGNDHHVSALIAGELSDSKGGYSYGTRYYGYDKNAGSYADIDYNKEYDLVYGVAQHTKGRIPQYLVNTGFNVNRFVSLLSNVSYTYKNRYSLYASARKDGANFFGVNTNNKWQPLWSASAGWEISKEAFFKTDWISHLRLKASFGYAGNSNNTLSGRFLIRYAAGNDEITALPYATIGRSPNLDLKWEEVGIFNSGIDFGLFKNRLKGSVEVFEKKSRDVIADAPMPPSSGANVMVANYAGMKTTGYEITLNSENTKGRFLWTTNLAWSYAKTIITKVNTSVGNRAADFLYYKLTAAPGQIAYGLSSYRWAGLDPATGDPRGWLNKEISKDYQAISTDSLQYQVFHGSALPLAFGYIRNNFTWKGITVTANITGRFNYYFREPALSLNYSANMGGTNYGADYYKRWMQPGDEAFTNVPSMSFPATSMLRDDFYRYAEIHVKRADNIRLQEFGITYQWNCNAESCIPVKTVRVFFYANNLNMILWRAADSPFDPDFSGGIGDGISIPTPKTWTVGATINF